MIDSPYFKSTEFDSPDSPGTGELMQDNFIKMLTEARERCGFPFIINSGYRTKEHNQLIGGRVGSSHLKGCACDLRVLYSGERESVLKALILSGFTRIGIAKTFIHVDSDPDKEAAIWLY